SEARLGGLLLVVARGYLVDEGLRPRVQVIPPVLPVGGAPLGVRQELDDPVGLLGVQVLQESSVIEPDAEVGGAVDRRHDFSPLRAPGAASGRVVSAVSVTTCIHYLHLDGDRKGVASLFLRPRSIFLEAEQLGAVPGQGVVGARRRAQRLDPVSYAVVARHDLPDEALCGRAQGCQGGAQIGRQGATEERGGRVGGRSGHHSPPVQRIAARATSESVDGCRAYTSRRARS